MKKIIAIAIATIMVLSCSMTSFASVEVDGESITESKTTQTGVIVTVNGNEVTTSAKDPQYVLVNDINDKLTVNGNVTGDTSSNNCSVSASNGAEITVEETVTSNNYNTSAIYVSKEGTRVIVGGDVTQSNNGDTEAPFPFITPAVKASVGTTVIVEGAVTGNICINDGDVYIGKLAENSGISWILFSPPIPNAEPTDYVHYLIGVADGSATLADILFGGDVGNDTVTGVDKGSGAKSYRYTNTADTSTDLTITLKSNVEGKQLKNDIGTLPAGVAKSYDNGVWTLTLGDGFKGGLQELQLLLEDIAHDNPDVPIDVVVSHSSGSSKPLCTGTWDNPVTNGSWHYDEATDKWSYSTVYKFTDTWGCIANPYADNEKGWFYFDKNGNMLTGWHWLNWNGVKRCYYLNTSKDTRRGKCQLGGVTPDGYTVDETGAWTVNGVVQEKK